MYFSLYKKLYYTRYLNIYNYSSTLEGDLLGLEHEIEDLIVESLEKGVVKSVEKLIDKGLINEIIQIALCELNKEILKLVELGVTAVIATGAIQGSAIAGAQNTVNEAINTTKETSLKQIHDMLINLAKTKYGGNYTKIVEKITKIKDVDELNSLAQELLKSENIEDFMCAINSNNIS